jgi:hypothetical protein
VLSGDDDASKIDASITKPKVPDGDDAEGEGTSFAEPISPNSISPNMPVQTKPFVTDRAASGAPSTSGHKRKRPLTIPKCKPPKTLPDQVMNQIVLPPYREPRSPLDLVAIEIIFGHLFEAFQRTSQAAGTSSSVSGDTQPLKKKKRRY